MGTGRLNQINNGISFSLQMIKKNSQFYGKILKLFLSEYFSDKRNRINKSYRLVFVGCEQQTNYKTVGMQTDLYPTLRRI